MTAWPCTRQMFPAIGSPYLTRMSAICWSAVLIPVILYQRSAVLAESCSRFVLIPTRVKADSFWGFQNGASQTLWWRTGGSPCGQGLRFAPTMTRPSFGHWRKRAGTRVKVGGCWRVAEIYDGGSRTEAARVGSVGLQTLRDWV